MRYVVVVVAVLLAACSATPAIEPSSSALATASVTQAPTASPSLTATPVPPSEAVVESFRVMQGNLMVVIKNPNLDVGLVRARFSLAVLAQDGTVITVLGGQGMPGSLASTIYQLPPQGEFVLWGDLLPEGAPAVANVELSVLDPWIGWATVTTFTPKLSAVTLTREYDFPFLRGRVLSDGDATYNIWVGAIYSVAGNLGTLSGVVDCVKPGENRAFELQGSPLDAGVIQLTRAVAYPTNVVVGGSTDC